MTTYVCTVDQAGATAGSSDPPFLSPSGTYVVLTDKDKTFEKLFLVFAQNMQREMLAVALTAISTQSEVSALVGDPPSRAAETVGYRRTCFNIAIIAD